MLYQTSRLLGSAEGSCQPRSRAARDGGEAVLQHRPQILQQDNSSKAGTLCFFLTFQAGEQHVECKAVPAIPIDLRQACPNTMLPFFPHAITLSSLFLALPAASQHASLYQKCSTRINPNIPQLPLPVIQQWPNSPKQQDTWPQLLQKPHRKKHAYSTSAILYLVKI